MERDPSSSIAALAGAALGLGRRGTKDRFVIEIRDAESGRLLAERGAGHAHGPAHGLLLTMEADRARLDIRAFTRRWRGRRPLLG